MASTRKHKKPHKPTKRERKTAEKAVTKQEAEAPVGAAEKAVQLFRRLKKLIKRG